MVYVHIHEILADNCPNWRQCNIQHKNKSQLTDTRVAGIKMSSERNTERVRRNISINFEILSRAKWFNGKSLSIFLRLWSVSGTRGRKSVSDQNDYNLWKRKINQSFSKLFVTRNVRNWWGELWNSINFHKFPWSTVCKWLFCTSADIKIEALTTMLQLGFHPSNWRRQAERSRVYGENHFKKALHLFHSLASIRVIISLVITAL